jgi:hypothetical protein
MFWLKDPGPADGVVQGCEEADGGPVIPGW